ncbi:hypothetical protein EPO17_01625 [Patescibacteria group bacterium]|nr:MAG: hypothetical protein EPO17_01625 [Patescibacteria group bacterium]
MKSYLKPTLGIFALVVVLVLVCISLYSRPTVPADTIRYENKEIGVSFLYPKSLRNVATTTEQELVHLALPLSKFTSLGYPETITFLKPIVITEPSDLEEILVRRVIFDGSGEHPDSIGDFKTKDIQGKRFYFIQNGRFEGIISYEFFFVTDKTVVPVSVRWYSDRWMDPSFVMEDDPRYAELLDILGTLRVD